MIMVTGGTGFIGSHLVEALCARGEKVRCLIRRRNRSFAPPSNAELVYGDLISGEGVEEALRGAKIVIHLAGVTKALSNDEYYAGNAQATGNLARALASGTAKAGGVRLVYVSSLSAIGPSLDGAPVGEDAEPHPVSHYGKSKLEGERIVRALLPGAVIVRPAVVYGPRDTDVFQIFKAINQGFVLKAGGEERWAQAIYVKDLVEGLVCAAGAPRANGRSYFLAHAKAVSWGELSSVASGIMRRRPRTVRIPPSVAYAIGGCAEVWSHLTGKPGIVSREKMREALCRYWTCDTRRAAEEIGFDARTPLQAGIAETLRWYKEAGWLKF